MDREVNLLNKDEHESLKDEHSRAISKKEHARELIVKNPEYVIFLLFYEMTFDRLAELLDLAFEEGWKNITDFSLILKCSVPVVCKSTLSTTRRNFTPGWLLKQVFSKSTCDWLADQLNKNYYGDIANAKHQHTEFTSDDMLKIGLTYLLGRLHPDKTWTAFRDNKDRKGSTTRELKRFSKYLDVPWKQFFERVNQDFKKCIQPGERATGDETVFPWMGDDPACVEIERKPNSKGFKVMTLSFQLTRTKR